MKIAFFHELHKGGARRSVNEFSKILRVNNKVDLFLVDNKKNPEERNFFTNVYHYNFQPKKWQANNWKIKLYKDTIELYNLYRLHGEIAKKINSSEYNAVFVNPSQFTQAPFILRFLKTKKIYYCQEPLRIVYDSIMAIPDNLNIFKKRYEQLIRFIRKEIDKSNMSCADIIATNSMYTRKNILKAYKRDSTICYLGVDTNFFSPLKIRRDVDILLIGSLEKIDGYHLLQKSIKLLKYKVNLRIVDNNEKEIKDEELVNMYRRSRVTVCFSRHEPFGLVPLEAMSCGVPVIALNEGGFKESLINNETGFLVSRDPKEIAKKIDVLLSNKRVWNKMSHAARQHVEKKWTWEKNTNKLLQLINNAQGN